MTDSVLKGSLEGELNRLRAELQKSVSESHHLQQTIDVESCDNSSLREKLARIEDELSRATTELNDSKTQVAVANSNVAHWKDKAVASEDITALKESLRKKTGKKFII